MQIGFACVRPCVAWLQTPAGQGIAVCDEPPPHILGGTKSHTSMGRALCARCAIPRIPGVRFPPRALFRV